MDRIGVGRRAELQQLADLPGARWSSGRRRCSAWAGSPTTRTRRTSCSSSTARTARPGPNHSNYVEPGVRPALRAGARDAGLPGADGAVPADGGHRRRGLPLDLHLHHPLAFGLQHAWLRNYKPHDFPYGMIKYYARRSGRPARVAAASAGTRKDCRPMLRYVAQTAAAHDPDRVRGHRSSRSSCSTSWAAAPPRMALGKNASPEGAGGVRRAARLQQAAVLRLVDARPAPTPGSAFAR